MPEESNSTAKKIGSQIVERTANVAEGGIRNATKFDIKIPNSGANVVNIIDKGVKNAKGKPQWWVRYDGPHRGANFPHINVNEAISGVPDPHTAITAGQLSVSIQCGAKL